MIAWKNEGEHLFAMLGEYPFGEVYSDRGEFACYIYFPLSREVTYHPTQEAAKASLERAVTEWVARAGLVALMSGEPSEEMVERMAIACQRAWWGPGDEHPWDKVPDAAKHDYRAGVRAALAAALKGQP